MVVCRSDLFGQLLKFHLLEFAVRRFHNAVFSVDDGFNHSLLILASRFVGHGISVMKIVLVRRLVFRVYANLLHGEDTGSNQRYQSVSETDMRAYLAGLIRGCGY